ncbi:uncharacterized protein LOC119310102 [Triticum dicoccoides]|uniref:uncharacterized protein LOC119310102 n=1 Tax=Triticum dicoccoides TaxID=85692 RepID=UPI0018910EF6|nr:uncharacterized protein LOC119310102 [Triticum dicoccoides]
MVPPAVEAHTNCANTVTSLDTIIRARTGSGHEELQKKQAVATSTQSHRESYLLHTSTQRSTDQHHQTSSRASATGPASPRAQASRQPGAHAQASRAAQRCRPYAAASTNHTGARSSPRPRGLPPVRRPAAGASHPRHGPPTPTPKLLMLFSARSAPPHLLRPCREPPSGAPATSNRQISMFRISRMIFRNLTPISEPGGGRSSYWA